MLKDQLNQVLFFFQVRGKFDGTIRSAYRCLRSEKILWTPAIARAVRELLTTDVVFRVYPDGDVIALFPGIDEGRGLCRSFMHFGQHGSADYSRVVRQTRPATLAESAGLRSELETAPYFYRLNVKRRWTYRDQNRSNDREQKERRQWEIAVRAAKAATKEATQ